MTRGAHLVKGYAPGLFVAMGVALLSVVVSAFLPYLGAATLALLLGIVLGNSGVKVHRLKAGLAFAEKKVLEVSIVLLGFGLNAKVFAETGSGTWTFVGISVIVVMGVAFFVGKAMGLSSKLSVLLGAGSAICGTTAIGAVSPLIKSKEEETGLSIGIVNLLGTVGLLLLPALTVMLAFTEEHAGIIIGGVLQSMGHVVGAGFTVGEEVGKLATIVKMGRIVLIIPLLLALYFMASRASKATGTKLTGFPLFVPLFIVAILIAQLPVFPQVMAVTLAETGEFLLIAAMVGIGFKIRLRSLFRLAGPALFAGALVFAFQILLFMAYLML